MQTEENRNKNMKFGITAKKAVDFHDWYTQIIIKSELLDYYDIRGCFIMRPQAMFIWKTIREYFEASIRTMGVEECYFPMLVSKKNLEQEKSHLANFNPELAWITRCGDKDIEEPVAIRPTSETIMYPAYARWLGSHRDLPLKLNQWCSVLRWEVKSTLPFIRGREFLWQEGHTAYYRKEEAEKEAMEILELYGRVYTDLLAVPVIKGRKSKLETFGGAEYTLSVEALIPGTGKGVQAATSHHLGQNFSRMFGIAVDDGAGGRTQVYQNCWGLTTRSIGIAVMIHSDDRGLVCPPRVAKIQAVVIPCGVKADTSAEERARLSAQVAAVEQRLREGGVRVCVDDAEHTSPGYKFNHWELRGVPCRLELGFRDLERNEICLVRRDTGEKTRAGLDRVVEAVEAQLEAMHTALYKKAQAEQEARRVRARDIEEMLQKLNQKCIVEIDWCGAEACEEQIGEKTTVRRDGEVVLMGAKSLCIPLEQGVVEGACVGCGGTAKSRALFGRSY